MPKCKKCKLFRMSRQCRTPSKVAHVIRTLSQTIIEQLLKLKCAFNESRIKIFVVANATETNFLPIKQKEVEQFTYHLPEICMENNIYLPLLCPQT